METENLVTLIVAALALLGTLAGVTADVQVGARSRLLEEATSASTRAEARRTAATQITAGTPSPEDDARATEMRREAHDLDRAARLAERHYARRARPGWIVLFAVTGTGFLAAVMFGFAIFFEIQVRKDADLPFELTFSVLTYGLAACIFIIISALALQESLARHADRKAVEANGSS